MEKIQMRAATPEDALRFMEIYNQAIAQGSCTCDTEPVSLQNRLDWIREHQGSRCPIFACLQGGQVIGYSYLTAYRPGRRAVENVAEVSYYLDFSAHGQGIGSWMLQRTIQKAEERGFTTLIAILVESNEKSIALLRKFGFAEWGRLPGIVSLGGRHLDHLYYGRHLPRKQKETGIRGVHL